MGIDRSRGRKIDSGRDPGGFLAIPWSVLDCPAYAALSHPARSLLFEIARQFVRDNNGRLLASAAYLEKRGWKSRDVITRAKSDLLNAGFIFETVKGHRPNKASWYAVTWRALDRHAGYDPGTSVAFSRGEYRTTEPVPKNRSLKPAGGPKVRKIGPSGGQSECGPVPLAGLIKPYLVACL